MAGVVIAPETGAGEPADGAPAKPWPAPRTARYALFLFVLATMINFLDRGVFGLMIESIKHDFQLSDIQVGLLLGPAGILFYVFIGIPLARLVDIYPRNIIVAAGLTVTSGITALGGLVQGYRSLFFSRMLVGVGGSAHAPGVYSMLADYFPPKKLPRAIAGLQFGFIFGTGFSMVLGGALLGMVHGWAPVDIGGGILIRSWQWVLIIVGAPGILIAALIFLLPEPPRRGKVSKGKALPIRDVLREIGKRKKVYFPLFIGLALSSVEANALAEWRAPFMMRTYGWTAQQIGAWSGVTLFVAMPIGLFFGTWLTEQLARTHKDANIRVTALLFGLTIPFAIGSFLMPSGELAVLCGAMSLVFGMGAAVPQNAAIQSITPNEMRGQVTAIYLFMFTAFGALGSFVVALITKYVVGDEQELWKSLLITASVLMPLATYAISRGIKPYGEEVRRLEAEGLM